MRLQQKILLIAVGLILCIGGVSAEKTRTDQPESGRRVLNLLTWSDYLDEDLVSRFEERFNAKLAFTFFETDARRNEMLARQGPGGFDLAIVDTSDIPVLKKKGWIAPFDPAQITNLGRLHPRCRSGREEVDDYGIPYFWGTQGIAYRSDLVDQPITRWMQLFRPAEQLRGKIVMIDDPWDLFGMALKALGKSMNSENSEDWDAAGRLVHTQKAYVGHYGYIAIDEGSGLVTGKVLAAQIYNGEALSLQEHNKDIVYAHPEEGSSYWVDHWVLFRQAPQPELAHAFLDFLNDPRNAAANAQTVYFATCNKSAEALLPREFLADPIIYPPPDVMRRLEPYRILSPRTTRKVNSLYTQIVTGP
ncbi:MAG: spermidine/putrescine ABC transporter substrate-binding protein [Chromatiaceae bacterium]|nr:spermidine/putrescine ABC transporter substrate-binding protein [Chromatiaceae bacterium]